MESLVARMEFCPKVLQFFSMNWTLTMESMEQQLFVKDQEQQLLGGIDLCALLPCCTQRVGIPFFVCWVDCYIQASETAQTG